MTDRLRRTILAAGFEPDQATEGPGGCCQVRNTLQIGPSEEVPDGDARWGVTWESKTPFSRGSRICDEASLAINFVSFATSSGDFATVTRAVELFLVRSSADISNRLDVWSVPLFKGTRALHFVQFEGGFPVPRDPAGDGFMRLRTLVAAGATTPWSILCGVMLTLQNRT
jgi:hypothetical protein